MPTGAASPALRSTLPSATRARPEGAGALGTGSSADAGTSPSSASAPASPASTSARTPAAASTVRDSRARATSQAAALRARVEGAAPSSAPAAAAPSSATRADLTALVKEQLALGLEKAGAGANELKALAGKADWEVPNQVANRLMDGVIEKATEKWKPEEKQALRHVLDTVDELAGGDGKLNYGDKLAVTRAILKDTPGILREAHKAVDQMVPGLGNRIAHRLVDNAYTPTRRTQRRAARGAPYRPGLFQRMRDNRRGKIEGEVAKQVDKQFNQIFSKLQVDPATAKKLDLSGRHLTVDSVMKLQSSLETLQRKFQGRSNPLTDGRLAGAVPQVMDALQNRVSFDEPVLKDGIPSPKRLDAVVDTLLHAASTVRVNLD